jgi:hypothetical protein
MCSFINKTLVRRRWRYVEASAALFDFSPWLESRCALSKLDIGFETRYYASMYFKRNQIEEAISRTFRERSVQPSSKLRTRLKRLLDLDRSLKRTARSNDPERANYAFYSSDAPGKGSEVLFSIYDACALLLGVRLLEHGWPQNFVVAKLRRVRPELDRKYAQILRTGASNIAPIEPQAGDIAVGNPDSPFLLMVSDDDTGDQPKAGPYALIFNNYQEALQFQLEKAGRSCSWFELEGTARALQHNLVGSLPRKRGRSS